MAPRSVPPSEDARIAELVVRCKNDPYKFVLTFFPWGVQGTELAASAGPDEWQVKLLCEVRDGLLTVDRAVQEAVASGHGVGKSALVAWIILWAMSTVVDTKGVVTANTESQLKTKTWAELAKWHRLLLNSHWFELTATALISTVDGHDKTWRVDMVAWSEKNSEAFAGLHNKGKRVLLVFDEASAIADSIWEVAEGALTDEDTQILWFAFGNPTRSRGRFHDCFGRFKARWSCHHVDSRSARMTNKKQLQVWIDDYGIDSDFVKVRVLGQFPSADTNALLSAIDVDAAMARTYAPGQFEFAARIMGVDVARQGSDDSVVCKRHGVVVFPLVSMHIPDTMLVARRVAQEQDDFKPDGTLVDATGGYGVGVIDGLRQLNREAVEVYFSGRADDHRYFNKRSEMHFLLAKWIQAKGSLPNDPFLREELLALTFRHQGDKFRLSEKEEIREELGRSPDRADALALTFAAPVSPGARDTDREGDQRTTVKNRGDYNPYCVEH